MKSFREDNGLGAPADVYEEGQHGLFRDNTARREVFRMLQQRLFERYQRSLQKQREGRE